MSVAQLMSGQEITIQNDDGTTSKSKTTVLFDGEELSMMELGFSPTFYQFIDTIIEVKIAIKMTREYTSERKVNLATARR